VLPEWIEHSTSPLPREYLALMLQKNLMAAESFHGFSTQRLQSIWTNQALGRFGLCCLKRACIGAAELLSSGETDTVSMGGP